ncbi:bacteriocin-like protein [Flavobacterium chryseum]|uniref:bacteriocin n=1 Tax=Flavobacterium sp. P3160 TaxID=2512113 RepID=UPI00105F2B1B|nr:bacteriocin [Flavobacterium sp. P3160]TDO83574.1 bacteriocin-like protein [Flavobacterium sp. P3160]
MLENLKGAEKLSINELKSIKGGVDPTCPVADVKDTCITGPAYCPNPRKLPRCVKDDDQS